MTLAVGHSKRNRRFWNAKSKPFFHMTLFAGRASVSDEKSCATRLFFVFVFDGSSRRHFHTCFRCPTCSPFPPSSFPSFFFSFHILFSLPASPGLVWQYFPFIPFLCVWLISLPLSPASISSNPLFMKYVSFPSSFTPPPQSWTIKS